MIYMVTSAPQQIAQPALKESLIVNDGTETIYLDLQSTVTSESYSLRLVPGQSFNYGGSQNLWAVCEAGKISRVSILSDANTSVAPVSNVTIAEPVEISGTVDVAGNVGIVGDVNVSGLISVDSINGNVNVDGSTVNIGNNVRLWGGGNYLGYKEYSILPTMTGYYPGFSTYLSATDWFPNLLLEKYAGIYCYIALLNPSSTECFAQHRIGFANGAEGAFIYAEQMIGSINNLQSRKNADIAVFDLAVRCPPQYLMLATNVAATYIRTYTFGIYLFGTYNVTEDDSEYYRYRKNYRIIGSGGSSVYCILPDSPYTTKIHVYSTATMNVYLNKINMPYGGPGGVALTGDTIYTFALTAGIAQSLEIPGNYYDLYYLTSQPIPNGDAVMIVSSPL